jgi:glycosyltransferase involved in cell wall biosynthesis
VNREDDALVGILMISPQFYPLVGGYERALARLSGAMVERGLRVVVITERRDLSWSAVECVDGYEVRRLWCWYRPHLHAVSSLLSFAVFLSLHGREFDVWHAHQYGLHAALAVALGKLLRRPVVLKLTSSGATGIERVLGSGFVGGALGFLHRRVSACLAVSEETRDEAIRFGIPPERVHTIPNAVDGRQFRPPSAEERLGVRKALGLRCEKLVLCVGRLSHEKNTLGLLDAWSTVDGNARAGALLALVGDGPEREEVRRRTEASDLAGSVHLAGELRDIATWYRAADVCVVPSDVEGLSNAMIEALATGVPVISTRVSGSSVLVEPPASGVLVDVGNVEQLARAIELLLSNGPMTLKLASSARQTFESHFSLEVLSKKVISLYEELWDQENERRPS